MSYRVVYGETMPAWEKDFSNLRAAKAFAKKHMSFGDIIFYVGPILGAPRSLMSSLT